jgi:hypothetical protein
MHNMSQRRNLQKIRQRKSAYERSFRRYAFSSRPYDGKLGCDNVLKVPCVTVVGGDGGADLDWVALQVHGENHFRLQYRRQCSFSDNDASARCLNGLSLVATTRWQSSFKFLTVTQLRSSHSEMWLLFIQSSSNTVQFSCVWRFARLAGEGGWSKAKKKECELASPVLPAS